MERTLEILRVHLDLSLIARKRDIAIPTTLELMIIRVGHLLENRIHV